MWNIPPKANQSTVLKTIQLIAKLLFFHRCVTKRELFRQKYFLWLYDKACRVFSGTYGTLWIFYLANDTWKKMTAQLECCTHYVIIACATPHLEINLSTLKRAEALLKTSHRPSQSLQTCSEALDELMCQSPEGCWLTGRNARAPPAHSELLCLLLLFPIVLAAPALWLINKELEENSGVSGFSLASTLSVGSPKSNFLVHGFACILPLILFK